MKKDTFNLVRVLATVTIVTIVLATTTQVAMAGDGYWDLFSVNLTPSNYPYWSQVNGGAGFLNLSDPLVSPDPGGSPVFDTASPLGGVTYGFGGASFGDGTLESTTVTGNSIQMIGTGDYYLSIVLDTASDPQSDHTFPSWGTFRNITIEQYDGTNWSVYTPSWTVSPYSPAGGTTYTSDRVTVGVGDIGDDENTSQISGIYGIGDALPTAEGYRVTFDTDLRTWDSYTPIGGPGGGQGTPDKPGNSVPFLTAVTGKEYSNMSDETSGGTLDPMQNIAFNGSGGASDTFDYSGTVPGIPEDAQVDAIANSLDAYFQEVVMDEVPLMLSFASSMPQEAGQIMYQMGHEDTTGTWATAQEINAFSPPDDVDGLELWGPENDDANMFSLEGDPNNVAVYRYDGAGNSVPYIMSMELMQAIGQGIGIFQPVDLDGLMVWDMEGDEFFSSGDSIMFTVKNNGMAFDGGEIFVWNFDMGVQFLNHGGETWNTAHDVGMHFGVNTEEVNALEAVPEPATMSLLAIGGLAILRRKRK